MVAFLQIVVFVGTYLKMDEILSMVALGDGGSNKRGRFLKSMGRYARLIPITAPAFCAGSCAPAGRSVPAWYAALLPSHSGCGWHRTADGSGAGPLPADFPAPRPGRSYPQVLPPGIPPGYLSACNIT